MPRDSSATPECEVLMTVNEIEGFSTGRFSSFCQCTVRKVLSPKHGPGDSEPKVGDQIIVIGGSFFKLRSLVQRANVNQKTCFCTKVIPNNNPEHVETTPWFATFIDGVYNGGVENHQGSKLSSLGQQNPIDRFLKMFYGAVDFESTDEMEKRIQIEMLKESLNPVGKDKGEFDRRRSNHILNLQKMREAIDEVVRLYLVDNAGKIRKLLEKHPLLNELSFPAAKDLKAVLEGAEEKSASSGGLATVAQVIEGNGSDNLTAFLEVARHTNTDEADPDSEKAPKLTQSAVGAETIFGGRI